MRLCALSVDLDELPNYHAIHGLRPPEGAAAHLVYDLALRRLGDLAATAEVPLTLFAIGADLARPESARALAAMAARGHEIGNHTLDHRYDLTRLPRDEQRRQVEGGAAAIEAATGQRPSGFRAPGYTVSDGLYDVLEELGVGYGSSVFPCPAYYLAKAAALGAIRARGRSSHSVLDDPRVLLAPTRPYRVGRPYQRRGTGLLELPVQVTRGLRLPFIGTTLTLLGAARARLLTRMVVGEPLVNLELHGIDVLDADDGFPELRPHQPDARVPHVQKLLALGAVVDELRRAGYSFVRLDAAARALG
ncbi:MAG: polysaccharide deacetylase family protein [Deltaproteobacteria bacterium]|nr:polysaccharide deacetylase family protein [Deltaproteobacteria bacterium]